MKIFSVIALLFILVLLVTIIIRLVVNKSGKPESNVKLGYFHANGNLDFYVSKDGQFVSRIEQHSFPLDSVQKITALADEQIIFSKSKEGTDLNEEKIEKIFNTYVNHITYQFYFKNGEKFESVVDVATNKRQKQSAELKQSFYKLTNLLNEIEVN